MRRKDSISTARMLSALRVHLKKDVNSVVCSKLVGESGIALVMVIVLSAIALIIMAGLIYMITMGTQVSGIEKRYKTAKEAALGGGDLVYQIMGLRGDVTATNSFISDINTKLSNSLALNSSLNSCAAASILSGTAYTGFAAKLNAATVKADGSANWSSCDSSEDLSSTSYDMKFDLGTNPSYRVYAKIVDTVEGNSSFGGGGSGGAGSRVRFGGVTSRIGGGKGSGSAGGEIQVMSVPYVYTIEVDAEKATNPTERAKLSILYQY